MATLKQRKVAKLVVENLIKDKPDTAGQLLEKVGYSKDIARQPNRILESDGVKSELEKLGFTLEAADTRVAHLLNNAEREETQLNAADKIYKRLGGYAPEKHANLNVNVTQEAGDIDLDLLVKEAENKLKEAKLNVETK